VSASAAVPDGIVADARRRRLVLGLTGGPGSGKSTFAARLVGEFADKGVAAVAVPMDGFHLPDAVLDSRGLADVKGAPSTFDRAALEALLDALRDQTATVFAPAYSRELHAPVPRAIAIPPQTQIVLVEGNYLSLWPSVREKLDEIWKLELPWEVARERLIARRIATGRDPQEARAWVDRVDAANALLVAGTPAHRLISDAG